MFLLLDMNEDFIDGHSELIRYVWTEYKKDCLGVLFI